MEPFHRDHRPLGPYFTVKTRSAVAQFILQGRWYNWSMIVQRQIVTDIQRNDCVRICRTPVGVWMWFLLPSVSRQPCQIFVRLTDIVMVTKKFELQLIYNH